MKRRLYSTVHDSLHFPHGQGRSIGDCLRKSVGYISGGFVVNQSIDETE